MDNLDKELNRRFQDERLSNDDFDTELLWGALEERLDEKRKPWFSFPFFVPGCLLFSLFLLGTAAYFFFLPMQQTSTFNQQENNQFVLPEIASEYSHSTNTVTQKKLNTITLSHKPTTTHLSLTTPLIPKEQIVLMGKAHQIPPIIQLQSRGFNSNQITLSESVSDLTLPQPIIAQQKSFQPAFNLTLFTIPKHTNLLPLPSSRLHLLDLIKEEKIDLDGIHPISYTISEPSQKTSAEPKSPKFTLSVLGGIHKSNFNYQNTSDSNLGKLKTGTESGDYGQYYELGISLITKKEWSIRSGIGYNKTWSIFDHTTTQSEQVTKENELLTIWVNGSDTLRREYGPKDINITTQTWVKHHNQSTQLSFPFMVGYQKSFGRIHYSIHAGTVFNLLLNQSGKTFDETGETIVRYETNTEIAPMNPFNIGIKASGFLGYQLNDQLTIYLNPNWTFQQHTQGTQQLQLQQFGLNLGVQMQFSRSTIEH